MLVFPDTKTWASDTISRMRFASFDRGGCDLDDRHLGDELPVDLLGEGAAGVVGAQARLDMDHGNPGLSGRETGSQSPSVVSPWTIVAMVCGADSYLVVLLQVAR